MEPEAPQSPDIGAVRGLPPVAPPSGRHIVQLFLVPGIIVSLFVLAYLGWNHLTRGWQTPEAFLEKLDNADPDVRWRAADDLAQVLLRDDLLASNPKFGLELAERLRQALDAGASAEKDYAGRSAGQSKTEQDNERKTLESDRDYIEYLSACLGNLSVPVGEPLLARMATTQGGADPEAVLRRRRRAVWALANLGKNLDRFGKLMPEQQQAVMSYLEQEAGASDEHGRWADAALQYLRGRQAGSPQALGVDEPLARCAADADPFLREMTAVALSYWQGSPAENGRMEDVLVKLLHDDGRGAAEDQGRWGLEIRSQAAVALVRRGSGKIDLDAVTDLLDEQQQLAQFRRKLPDGQDVPDEAVAYATVSNTLKALAEWRRQDPGRDFSKLNPALDRLTRSPNLSVRSEAERTLIVLGGQP